MSTVFEPTPLEQLRIACSLPDEFSAETIDRLVGWQNLELLTAALTDGSPPVRQVAISKLGELAAVGNRSALQLLGQRLAETDDVADSSAIIRVLGDQCDQPLASEALTIFNEEAKHKFSTWSRRNNEFFHQIIRFAGTEQHVSTMEMLVRLLKRNDFNSQRAAVVALASFIDARQPQTIKTLLSILNIYVCYDGDEVLTALGRLLGTTHEKAVVNKLVRLANSKTRPDSKPPNLPQALARFLRGAHHERVAAALLKLGKCRRKIGRSEKILSHSEKNGLMALPSLIGTPQETQALAAVASWLPSQRRECCQRAIRALVDFADSSVATEAAWHLLTIANSERWIPRSTAVEALGKFAQIDAEGSIRRYLLTTLEQQGQEKQQKLERQLCSSLIEYAKRNPCSDLFIGLLQIIRNPKSTASATRLSLEVIEETWGLFDKHNLIWKAITSAVFKGKKRDLACYTVPLLGKFAGTPLAKQALEKIAELLANTKDGRRTEALDALGEFADHPQLTGRAAQILIQALGDNENYHQDSAVELAREKFSHTLAGLVENRDPRTPGGVKIPNWVQQFTET